MASIHDWFLTVAASLNDDKPGAPFRRYALKDLVAYFNDALCMIAKHRPDLFTKNKNVKLSCGSYQDTRGCCVNVFEVEAQVDAFGNVIKNLTTNRKTDTKVRSVWDKPSCLSKSKTDPITGNPMTYVIDTASVDTRDNGGFSVVPPVPKTGDYYALIRCLEAPCTLTEADVLAGTAKFPIDCGYLAAIRFYVTAWALSGDRHSTSAQAEAQRLFAFFFQWLGVAEAQERKYEKEVA